MDLQACTIGVDLGTTTVKAASFDVKGREVAGASQEVELKHPDSQAAEQSPQAVHAAVTQVLASVSQQSRERGYTATRIGLSSAMHSLVLVSEGNIPLTPAITWMDERAKDEADALWGTQQGKDLYARTGTPVHPMAPLPKLLWLRKQRSELFQEAARFVSLKEWVWYQWFGEWQVDASIASATGLYNLQEQAWDAGALSLARIDPDRLSAIVPTVYSRSGCHDPDLAQAGIGPDVEFTIGASDGVLANLGEGVIGTGTMSLTIGTSLALRLASFRPVTDVASRLFCYVLDADRFVVGAPSNSGGYVLDWLYHHVLSGRRPEEPIDDQAHTGMADMFEAAQHVQAGELLCVPYITGERAPVWSADAKGVFFGLDSTHSGVHLMRAAIEGILLNASWIAEGLFAKLDRPRRIVASGHVLDQAWARQLAANIIGLPVVYRGTVDASTKGAALLADIAAGVRTWQEVEEREGTGRQSRVEPAEHEKYRRKSERYRKLCSALMGDLADVYLAEVARQE